MEAPDRFEAAFQRLMSRAPGPVFPRARRLYFDKYPLEGIETASAFHTHLLEETVEEGRDGSLVIHAGAFALVPCDPQQAPGLTDRSLLAEAAARYLLERWQRSSRDISAVDGPWFRTQTGYLRVVLSGLYRTGGGAGISLSQAGQ